MINPELIRTFLALAETRHFTRASRRLGMTQPGVSQHLRKLESYFGTALLQRQGKSFTLTDAGKKLVVYGDKLFKDHRRFQERLESDDPHSGALRFASPGSFALKVFDVLMEEAGRHPDLTIDVMVAPNTSVVGYLREERVDAGFMSEEPRDPAVEHRPFAQEQLLLALPRDHRRRPDLASLRELGYVGHPDGFQYGQKLLSRNFPGEFEGMEGFPVSVFINQINRILDPVARGLGFAILPETACRRYHRIREIRLVALRHRVVEPIFLVTRRGEKLPARYDHALRQIQA